jgi:hypothetical protein
MPVWTWIPIGIGSFLFVSLLVGLFVARVLGTVSHAATELYETEMWALMPPSRTVRDAEPQADESERDTRVVRLR